MKRTILILTAALLGAASLAGCVVAPVRPYGYYGGGYVAAPVVVAPPVRVWVR